ncbi:MAG: CorA family divalent cation transporter [Lachnospiraceae bacterium]|nr:CorA family divalent cation transporter [Lachnospiraceae bacterium]
MYFLLKKTGEMGTIIAVDETDVPCVVKQLPAPEEIHGCMVSRQGKELCCVMQLPVQKEMSKDSRTQTVPILGQGHTFLYLSFLVIEDGIWFADYDGVLERMVQNSWGEWEEKPPEILLYRIFCKLVENDVRVLDTIYKQLASLESEIPRENARFFLQKMYTMKHSIYQLFRFYHQLTEMAEDLMEWDGPFLSEDLMDCFQKFIIRTKRLSDDMEIMREYAMEIWEIYQSQISIRQNDIMKVLTIVTTIFLPLSLLAGWYGMNFEYMPEISWKYGYPMVIGVSLSIVAISLIIFRKKRYW